MQPGQLSGVLGALLVGIAATGCVFDEDGIGAIGQDSALDQATDTAADVEPDRAPDLRSDADMGGPVCTPASLPSEPVCQFSDREDQIGESGLCQGETFVISRKCFEGAPCVKGVCTIQQGCVACWSRATCEGVCTVVFDPSQGIGLCCVGQSDNGNGDHTTACDEGTDCRTGLCSTEGRCFEPCERDDDCGNGGVCGPMQITIAGDERERLGCRPGTSDGGNDSTAVDAGTDAVTGDSGADASTDVETDAGSDVAVDAAADIVAG